MAIIPHGALKGGSHHVRVQELVCEIDEKFVEAILPIRLNEWSTGGEHH